MPTRTEWLMAQRTVELSEQMDRYKWLMRTRQLTARAARLWRASLKRRADQLEGTAEGRTIERATLK